MCLVLLSLLAGSLAVNPADARVGDTRVKREDIWDARKDDDRDGWSG